MRKLIKDMALCGCVGLGHLYRPKGIPILVYHSIDNSHSDISIPPEIFVKQMNYLKREGFQVISLNQLMLFVSSGREVFEKILVLTFDDGLKNFYEAAWPILNRFGFSATLFVPTDYIGQTSSWYTDYGLKPFPMLGWDELRELTGKGIDVQSHGCSHQKLPSLTLSMVQRELRESKDVLERGLGRPTDFFCYPFGEVSSMVLEEVKHAGYRGATGMGQGCYRVGDDPYLMKRESLDYISITDERTASLSIKACTQGTFAWYVRAKRRLKTLCPLYLS